MKPNEKLLKILLKPPIWVCAVIWTLGILSLGGSITLYFLGFGGKLWALPVHIVALVFFILSIYAILTIIGIPTKAKDNIRVKQFFSEYSFRAFVYAACSIVFNTCYVVFGIIIANLERSVWLGALVGYHVFLILPRLTILYIAKIRGRGRSDEGKDADTLQKQALKRQLQAYMYSGLALTLLAFAVLPVIHLTMTDRNTYNYMYSATIYVISIALYAFTKFGIAIYNMKKARRNGDMSLIAVKNISFADALISIFALQAMMLKVLDGGDAALAAQLNPVSGAAVAAIIFALGLHMLVKGVKRLKSTDWGEQEQELSTLGDDDRADE